MSDNSDDIELEKKVHEYLLRQEREFIDFWFSLSGGARPIRPKINNYIKLTLAGVKTDTSFANGVRFYSSYCTKNNEILKKLKKIDKYIESYKQKYPAYFIQFE